MKKRKFDTQFKVNTYTNLMLCVERKCTHKLINLMHDSENFQ